MNCDTSQLTPRLINQQGFWLLTIHLRWAITIDIGFNEYIATTWVFKRTVASCGFSQVSMLDIAAFELHASRNIAQLQDPQPIVIRWPKTIIKYLHIEYNTRHVYIYILYNGHIWLFQVCDIYIYIHVCLFLWTCKCHHINKGVDVYIDIIYYIYILYIVYVFEYIHIISCIYYIYTVYTHTSVCVCADPWIKGNVMLISSVRTTCSR